MSFRQGCFTFYPEREGRVDGSCARLASPGVVLVFALGPPSYLRVSGRRPDAVNHRQQAYGSLRSGR
eukprot:11193873-Heterocapsa_arctica.AAC.1